MICRVFLQRKLLLCLTLFSIVNQHGLFTTTNTSLVSSNEEVLRLPRPPPFSCKNHCADTTTPMNELSCSPPRSSRYVTNYNSLLWSFSAKHFPMNFHQ